MQAFADARVLVVDDQAANVLLLRRILERQGFERVKTTTDARDVLPLFAAFEPDILLLDLHMPYLDGFDVLGQIRQELGEDCFVPTVILTADSSTKARDAALSMGADDYLTKPFDPIEVVLRVRNLLNARMRHLRLSDRNGRLEQGADSQRRALESTRIEVLERLARAAELRDDDTHAHTLRVGDMAAELGAVLGLDRAEQETLRRSAPLHDIGKIGISDAILLKPGRLTDDELVVMRTHATIGAELLSGSQIPVLQSAHLIALGHHEKWDGSGYPNGVAGEAIALHARITALADVFDALTHSRPYKEAWPLEDAIAEIADQRGRHFDPCVVDAFLQVLDDRNVRAGVSS